MTKYTILITLLLVCGNAVAENQEACFKKDVYGRCVSFLEIILEENIKAYGNIFLRKNQTAQVDTKKSTVRPDQRVEAKKSAEISWSKPKKHNSKCDNPDLEWREFVACTNEKMKEK